MTSDAAEEHLQSALADHYSIERELGRGGMATVYLARDVTPAWLRIDPNFAKLRGDPRFERLIAHAAQRHLS